MERFVCRFSCGAASAVATKITLSQKENVEIINAFVAEEHEDNRRFLLDCEAWFKRKITVLKNEKYNGSAIQVFKMERFLKNRNGAPCTRLLKKKILDQFCQENDVMVLGYTLEEKDRMERFVDRYPEIKVWFPLIENNLDKEDCKQIIRKAGIELPLMYRMGYANANCIGCVKGGMGYWRAIREDFPERFEEIASIEESLGPGAYLFRGNDGNRVSLRMLPDGPVQRNSDIGSCSFFCESVINSFS